MANLSVSIDRGLKRDVENILCSLGISTNDAINLYFNRIRESSGIPVEIVSDIPTQDTVMAMDETINDIKNGNIKVFYNSDDVMNDLLSD